MSPNPDQKTRNRTDKVAGSISSAAARRNSGFSLSINQQLRKHQDMIMEPVVALEIKSDRKKPPDSSQSKSAVDGPGFLPVIAPKQTKRESRSIVPKPMFDMSDDSDTSTTNIDQMRRASKRAIHLLMKNMKSKQRSGIWVPSGRQIGQSKIFHRNYNTLNSRTNLSQRS